MVHSLASRIPTHLISYLCQILQCSRLSCSQPTTIRSTACRYRQHFAAQAQATKRTFTLYSAPTHRHLHLLHLLIPSSLLRLLLARSFTATMLWRQKGCSHVRTADRARRTPSLRLALVAFPIRGDLLISRLGIRLTLSRKTFPRCRSCEIRPLPRATNLLALSACIICTRPVLKSEAPQSAEDASVSRSWTSVCFVEKAKEFRVVQQALQYGVAVTQHTGIAQALSFVYRTPEVVPQWSSESCKGPAFTNSPILHSSHIRRVWMRGRHDFL
jgi:hypothetical protein